MSAITLTVLIHGLIVLAPAVNGAGGNYMNVLLLDARQQSSMECMGVHSPKLTVLVPNNTGCQAAGCHLSGSQCDCTDSLAGKLVKLEISPAPDQSGPGPNNQAPTSEIPSSRADAGDYAYVANLARPPFSLTLNQAYLSAAPPTNLLARMEIPFKSITACSLVTRESKGEAHVQSLSFHKLRRRGVGNERSQALAQMVVARLSVPDNGTGDQIVRLHITNLDGSTGHTIDLAPGQNGYLIEISNEADVLDRDVACEDGVARHFDHFYDLADASISPPVRLIPHVIYTAGPKAEDLQPPECVVPTFNVMDRPICPMATFNP